MASTRSDVPPSSPEIDEGEPLSHGQRALWFLQRVVPDSTAYNVAVPIRVRSAVDVDALRRTFQRLVDRHPALRTTFPARDGVPVQRVARGAQVSFEVEDAQSWPIGPLKLRLLERVHRPFDLERGPLFDVRLHTLAPDDHVLLVRAHHIVMDLWSTTVLLDEMAAIYPAEVAGEVPALPPLVGDYRDFVRWQARMLAGADGARHWEYWKTALAGELPPLDLTTDRPRPDHPRFRGASHRFAIGAELTRRFTDVAHVCRSTLFGALLAAFQTLLHRASGQDIIAVGSPTGGRTSPEFEQVVGYFVNVVVFRADLSADPAFDELLRRTRDAVTGALEHQDFPFALVVDRLQARRDPGRSPLFQAMLSLERPQGREGQSAPSFLFGAEGAKRRLGSLELEPLHLDSQAAQFDLTLVVTETGESLSAAFEYDSDLFERATVERLAGAFSTLLESIARDPTCRLSSLRLVADAERDRIVAEWSGTDTPRPRDRGVHDLIRSSASLHPDAPAVIAGAVATTYRDLLGRASAIAHRLRAAGAGPGAIVALAAERSPDLVAGMLGILEAGAAWLAIDPGAAPERAAFILRDARVRLLLAAARDHMPVADGVAVLSIDQDGGARPPVLDGCGPLAAARESDPAYVVYTSGSTGEPKGVLVPHGALANHAVAIARLYGLGPDDRVLQFAPPTFDVSAEEIFPTLLRGAALVLLPGGPPPDVRSFVRLLVDERVTVVNLPASFWHEWAAQLEQDAELLPPGLRLVVTGSERVRPERVAAWRAAAGDRVRLVNAYGPTEATITATAHDATAASDAARVAIGRPIANVRAYVLDRHLQLLAPGIPGEVYLGGDGLALGYLGRPGATAERFLPDPFAAASGSRLYRTGDRARLRPDGNLDFLGRADDQVKIRGFRIEPAEVEAALRRHRGVGEAVVVAREDPASRLVAYVVPAAGREPPTAEALRAHLRGLLPAPMIPAAFVALADLPRAAGGKPDRGALPPPEEAPSGTSNREPPGAIETTLGAIWAEVLGLPRVGMTDNFFSLGGDSILALRVIARANQAGLRLASKHLFQHQTVTELAAAAAAAQATLADQGPVVGDVALTPIQRWFFALAAPEPDRDNQAVLLDLREPLGAAVIEAALARLVEHHDMLRSRFQRTSGGWRQSVAPPGSPIRIATFDLSDHPADQWAADLARALDEIQASPCLEAGPLVRAALFERGPGRPAALLLLIHHLVVDGVSWRILLEDLASACRAIARGAPAPLPDRTSSFQAWAARLVEHASSAGVLDEARYWLDQTRRAAELAAPAIPTDLPGGPGVEADARQVAVTLTRAETHSLLREVAARRAASLEELLLAALVESVSAWTGGSSLLVDLEGHGREPIFDDLDLSRTVGWFTTMTPILLERDEGGNRAATLARVRRALRSIPRRGIGHGLLRWASSRETIARELSARRPPQLCFNYLGQFDQVIDDAGPFRFAGEPLGALRGPRNPRAHLLDANALVSDGCLRIELGYSERAHHRATIERLAERVAAELRGFIDRDSTAAHAWNARDPAIEDVYPLTPMQEGMLFHSLEAREPGAYVEQMSWTFEGDLDVSLLEKSWAEVVGRHPILRTAILWDGVDRPLQIVRREVVVGWDHQDWRALSPSEQDRRLEAYRRADRAREFDLARAPLLRIGLVRLAGDRWHFVWTHHHAILDGWSVPLLLAEVARAYRAARRGETLRLAPAPRFRDFVDWLGRRRDPQEEAFWRRTMAGFTEATPIAIIDRPAPSRRAGAAGEQHEPEETNAARHRRLSREASSALVQLAREHGLTLGSILHAAWALLIARYSGRDDVLFGSVMSGRPPSLQGADATLGMFAHTLPLRARAAPGERVLTFLQSVQTQLFAMLEHPHATLIQLHGWSEVARGCPLFETLFAFENYPEGERLHDLFAGVRVRDLQAEEKTSYPITAIAAPGPELGLQIVYDRRRCSAPEIDRMLGHFATLLDRIAARPGDRLGDLSLLTAAEIQTVIGEWNATATDDPRDRCIHDLFADAVARHGERIALVCGDQQMTYLELDRRADDLARRLRAFGVGPEVAVGLLMDRSTAAIVGMLGVLKAGGAYLPLDPSYPPERLAFMIADARAPLLVTEPELLGRLPASDAGVLCLLPGGELAGHAGSGEGAIGDGAPRARAENQAYVMYTSGSTGAPKGVCVPHRAVVRLVRAACGAGAGEGEVILQAAPLSFDASTFEIWRSLLLGGRLAVLPGRAPGLDDIGEALRAHRVTTLWLTAGLFHAMVDERLDDLRGLRLLLAGGDVLSPRHVRSVLESIPGLELVNGYGPTEGTTFSSCHSMSVPSSEARGRERVPIGRPIANTRVYILDRWLQPVPQGIAGELFIGGDGLARGYVQQAALTAERFIPDPFGEAGARLYRSGDLGRWLDGGVLEFLGRLDDQVKVRGHRVEPGEIEAALADHPAVKDCAVVAREDAAGERLLVAFAAPRDGSLDAAALRAHLRDRLPAHLVPAAFVVTDRLPLNASGKVDRRALAALEPAPRPPHPPAPPETPLERELIAIWSAVLELDQVGIDDDFFELGGHSLIATRLVSRMRSRVAPDLRLADLYSAPTVRGLARRVEERRGAP